MPTSSPDKQLDLLKQSVTEALPSQTKAWARRQRLLFIEQKLFWDGELNRSHLIRRFSISRPQATNDLSLYKKLAPGNLAYSASDRVYRPSRRFSPVLEPITAETYLHKLYARSAGLVDGAEGIFPSVVPTGLVPSPTGSIDRSVLQAVVRAVSGARVLEIEYQSLSKAADRHTREVCPHSLAYNGRRWHMRAFDHENDEFRDFVIGRIYSATVAELAKVPRDLDLLWNSRVSVDLAPCNKYSDGQREVICRDYGLDNGPLEVRAAMWTYVKAHLHLHPPESQRQNDPEAQIFARNHAEVEAEVAQLARKAKLQLSQQEL